MSVSTISKVNEKNTTNDIRINNLTVDGTLTNTQLYNDISALQSQVSQNTENISTQGGLIAGAQGQISAIENSLNGLSTSFIPNYTAINGSITTPNSCLAVITGGNDTSRQMITVSGWFEGVSPSTGVWVINIDNLPYAYDSFSYTTPISWSINGTEAYAGKPFISGDSYFQTDNSFFLYIKQCDLSNFTANTSYVYWSITYQKKF